MEYICIFQYTINYRCYFQTNKFIVFYVEVQFERQWCWCLLFQRFIGFFKKIGPFFTLNISSMSPCSFSIPKHQIPFLSFLGLECYCNCVVSMHHLPPLSCLDLGCCSFLCPIFFQGWQFGSTHGWGTPLGTTRI